VLDLDPGPPSGLLECCEVALRLRDELAATGLEAFPKTSGSLGLHLYVPLNTPHAFAETKAFARALAETVETERPELVTSRQRRDLRAGRVLVDWLQNDPTRSTVAAYSLRATAFPTVSTPLRWAEVEAALRERAPERLVFGPRDVLGRLERDGDLFAPVLEREQSLPCHAA
jgi:bifunctional non-homologous end joining protein LigD